jgi:fibronectin type 3 domain-containing protein
MRPEPTLLALSKSVFCLFAILALSFSFPSGMHAQAPSVPASFQPMYTELNNYLVNFNATLAPGSNPPYPTLMSVCWKAVDSNSGPSLVSGMNFNLTSPPLPVNAQMQLNALKAMGVQAVLVEVGFPMLYTPFLASQNAAYPSQFTTYYQTVANAVRAAGLKLIIENDTLLVNDVEAGWDVAPFYATLNWTEYQAARAQTAVTIAQLMLPDYLVVLEEPNTEAYNSNQPNANTLSGSLSLLNTMLTSVQQAGVENMKVGAGTSTAQVNPDAMSFIQEYVTTSVDFIDFHIYPVNDNNLPIALEIASTAAAAGKPVAMTECWLWKVLDTELGVLTDDVIRARDPFSFWAPLDAYFLQTMQSLANSTQMLFLDPFGAEYLFTYLTYDDSTENLSPSAILNEEDGASATETQNAWPDSISGMSYYNSLVTPPDTAPPTVPTDLSGVSANPTTAVLNWKAAADNIGVAGYYILRGPQNGPQTVVGTTGMLSYQDSGLTEATTYTYTIEAFDLAGNASAPSASFTLTTFNVTPPSTPANVTAQAVACTKVILNWSPSTDNIALSQYIVFMGPSPTALTQLGVAGISSKPQYGNDTLSPGTTYYFGVQAEDKDQNISYMSAVVAVTTPTLPVAPASVLPVAESTTKISVTWSASTGGLTIAHYFVYRGASSSTLAQVATVNNTSYTDNTATAATTYYYAIQASDSGTPASTSGLSTPVAVTTYSPPSVPAGLVATPISCTKVSLTWLPAVSGGLPLSYYHVYKGTSPTALTQIASTPNTTYNDTTDMAQTTYYYAVQATDTGKPPDLSAISPPVEVTTYAYPGVPTNLVATPESSTKITLTWTASVSGGLNISNYHVYGGTSPSKLSQIGVTTNTTYNNMQLTAGTTYYYAVQAVDTANDDSALSGTVSATTFPLPSAPSNVVAQGTSSSEIAVSWAPSSGVLPIAHYYVFRGSSPGNLSQVATTINPSYNDRSLSAGTTYYYGIQAADTGGDHSAISSPAVAGSTQP